MTLFGRRILPAIFVLAGIAVIVEGLITGRETLRILEYSIPLISAGASIWFFFFLWGVGLAGDTERDAEAEARAYFAEHGRWPDDPRSGSDAA